MSYMCKLESWFIRVIESIHLHYTVVSAYDDVRQTIASQVGRGQARDTTVLSLVEHVPAIARLGWCQLHQTNFTILCSIEYLLTILT